MDATVLVCGADPVGRVTAAELLTVAPDGYVGAVMSLDDDQPGPGYARAVRAG